MSSPWSNPRPRKFRPAWLTALVVAGSFLATLPAGAQDAGEEAEPAPAVPLSTGEQQADAPDIVLLREGSHLVRVVGRLCSDTASGSWTLTIDPDAERMPNYELTLLPCSYLEEVQQVIVAAPEHELIFEITGQVFVYHDRNYVMPTHPPLLVGHTPETRDEVADDAPTGTEETPPTSAQDTAATSGGGQTAADIIKELEASTRPPVRRPAAAPDSRRGDAEKPKLRLEGTVLTDRRREAEAASGRHGAD